MRRGLVHETTQWSPRFGAPPIDLFEHVDAAATAGYRGIFLDRWSLDAHVADGRSLRGLAAAVSAAGLEVAATCTLAVTDEAGTRADGEALLPVLDALRPDVLVAVFRAPVADDGRRGLEHVARRAATLGVRVAVEPLPYGHVPDLAAGEAVLTGLDADVGLVVDAWHVCRGPEQWDRLAGTPAAAIAYVQLSDAPSPTGEPMAVETVHRRVPPGEGELDLDRFLASLRSTGYDGWVGVEVLSAELRPQPVAGVAARLHAAAAEVLQRTT